MAESPEIAIDNGNGLGTDGTTNGLTIADSRNKSYPVTILEKDQQNAVSNQALSENKLLDDGLAIINQGESGETEDCIEALPKSNEGDFVKADVLAKSEGEEPSVSDEITDHTIHGGNSVATYPFAKSEGEESTNTRDGEVEEPSVRDDSSDHTVNGGDSVATDPFAKSDGGESNNTLDSGDHMDHTESLVPLNKPEWSTLQKPVRQKKGASKKPPIRKKKLKANHGRRRGANAKNTTKAPLLVRPKLCMRRNFSSEELMPMLAIVHEKQPPDEKYCCYNQMISSFKKNQAVVHYQAQDLSDLIKPLKPFQIIAIAGHLLGYLAVWDPSKFNAWMGGLGNDFRSKEKPESEMEEARTM